MNSQYELVELLSYLETAEIHPLNEIKTAIFENLNRSKEPWLVNAVVDLFMASNSKRCLDVLICINEPHDKHLFDRLNEHMKGSQKIGALVILAHLVRREPVWLHKIVSVQLLPTMLKTLKVETDGLVLLTGALILTGLLPVVPVSIAPFIQDICDVFYALAMFCLNKSGNVSGVYLLHMQVGLHCMFHRLYSMYPCNFLSYLRSVFSRPENVSLFDNIIKPMFNMVKMHPFLISGTKEKEFSRDRWKEKEVHDIIVECAQLSFDPFDREFSEARGLCSFTDRRSQKFSRADGSQEFSWQNVVSSVKPSASANEIETSDNISLGAIWTPSRRCGLSTPPPGVEEVNEKTNQITAQAPVLNVPSQESIAGVQATSNGNRVEPSTDNGVKCDDLLLDTNAKASDVPPLTIEPPTPPDISRGSTDGKSSSNIFGICLSSDYSPSSDSVTVPMSALSQATDTSYLSTSMPSGPSEAETNAAEMAALMKKMKRIRLYSTTITQCDLKSSLPLSRSCPHLLVSVPVQTPEEDGRLSSSQDGLDGSNQSSCLDKWTAASSTTPLTKSSLELSTSRTSPVAVKMVSEESQTGFYVFAQGFDDAPRSLNENEEKSIADEAMSLLPFELLLGHVLPFAPFVQCFCCMRHHWEGHPDSPLAVDRSQCLAKLEKHPDRKPGCIIPLHVTCSPSYLLDRHVIQSCELRGKTSETKLTPSSLQSKSVASADDLSVLRAHVTMMHNQVTFERHRQELHAKRNRRLLGRTVKVVSLEEQNTAMRDQLRLQESEMNVLRCDLQTLRKENHDWQERDFVHKQQISEQNRKYLKDVDELKLRVRELEDSLTSQKSSNDQLVQTLERTNNTLFSKTRDLELQQQKIEDVSHLEQQVVQSNTELLLMGELHQKYQQRLSEMSLSHNIRPQLQMRFDSCKAECQALQSQLKEKTTALDEANHRVETSESRLKLLEGSIAELKNQFETSQTLLLEHIQKLEEKLKFERKAQQSLHVRTLELQSEAELLKNRHPARGPSKATNFVSVGTATEELDTATSGSAAATGATAAASSAAAAADHHAVGVHRSFVSPSRAPMK